MTEMKAANPEAWQAFFQCGLTVDEFAESARLISQCGSHFVFEEKEQGWFVEAIEEDGVLLVQPILPSNPRPQSVSEDFNYFKYDYLDKKLRLMMKVILGGLAVFMVLGASGVLG